MKTKIITLIAGCVISSIAWSLSPIWSIMGGIVTTSFVVSFGKHYGNHEMFLFTAMGYMIHGMLKSYISVDMVYYSVLFGLSGGILPYILSKLPFKNQVPGYMIGTVLFVVIFDVATIPIMLLTHGSSLSKIVIDQIPFTLSKIAGGIVLVPFLAFGIEKASFGMKPRLRMA